MLAGADDLAGLSARAANEGPRPARAGAGEVRGQGRRPEPGLGSGEWQAIGTLAGNIVDGIKDRAARNAPRVEARAPAAGSVATEGRRRPLFGKETQVPTIGTTHFFATILAGLARERPDRGEPLIQFVEAEAEYLKERMPGTADAMRDACQEARRLRGRAAAAE